MRLSGDAVEAIGTNEFHVIHRCIKQVKTIENYRVVQGFILQAAEEYREQLSNLLDYYSGELNKELLERTEIETYRKLIFLATIGQLDDYLLREYEKSGLISNQMVAKLHVYKFL